MKFTSSYVSTKPIPLEMITSCNFAILSQLTSEIDPENFRFIYKSSPILQTNFEMSVCEIQDELKNKV